MAAQRKQRMRRQGPAFYSAYGAGGTDRSLGSAMGLAGATHFSGGSTADGRSIATTTTLSRGIGMALPRRGSRPTSLERAKGAVDFGGAALILGPSSQQGRDPRWTRDMDEMGAEIDLCGIFGELIERAGDAGNDVQHSHSGNELVIKIGFHRRQGSPSTTLIDR